MHLPYIKMKLALPILLLSILLGCRTNESPEAQVDDLKISAQLKTKFISDIGPDTIPNISINSTNCIVTLSGQVDSAATKAKAESIAKSVPNVVRVVNNLQVTPKPGQTPTSSRSSSRRVACATCGRRTPRRWKKPYVTATTSGSTPIAMNTVSGRMRSHNSVSTSGC